MSAPLSPSPSFATPFPFPVSSPSPSFLNSNFAVSRKQGGEDRYQIVKVIVNAVRTLASTRYGADAISLQLAQVGNDMKARAFLEEIDVHPEVGPMVDVRPPSFSDHLVSRRSI